jgi:hypothetical protein
MNTFEYHEMVYGLYFDVYKVFDRLLHDIQTYIFKKRSSVSLKAHLIVTFIAFRLECPRSLSWRQLYF